MLEASFGPTTQRVVDRVWNCTVSRRRVSLHFSETVSLLQSHHKAPFFYPSPSAMLFTIVIRVDSLPDLELSQNHYKLISSYSK